MMTMRGGIMNARFRLSELPEHKHSTSCRAGYCERRIVNPNMTTATSPRNIRRALRYLSEVSLPLSTLLELKKELRIRLTEWT